MRKFIYFIDVMLGDYLLEEFEVSKERFKEIFDIMKKQGVEKFRICRPLFGEREIWYYSETYKDWFPFGSIYIED